MEAVRVGFVQEAPSGVIGAADLYSFCECSLGEGFIVGVDGP